MPSRLYDGAEKRASGSASGIESESCHQVLLVRRRMKLRHTRYITSRHGQSVIDAALMW